MVEASRCSALQGLPSHVTLGRRNKLRSLIGEGLFRSRGGGRPVEEVFQGRDREQWFHLCESSDHSEICEEWRGGLCHLKCICKQHWHWIPQAVKQATPRPIHMKLVEPRRNIWASQSRQSQPVFALCASRYIDTRFGHHEVTTSCVQR